MIARLKRAAKTGATLLAAAGFTLSGLASAPAAAADARGEQLYQLCQQCHGDNGEGMALFLAPSIAGQDAWYLEGQLRRFRDGARGVHPEDV
ncbi:MAG: c-type cytochrome, partial [Myxococcales bacterium]|nr:c-type cytochrome [Myxococcales bacterium]